MIVRSALLWLFLVFLIPRVIPEDLWIPGRWTSNAHDEPLIAQPVLAAKCLE